MRLSDVMSHLDLTVYPEIGLVLFLSVFVAVVLRVWHRRRGEDFAAIGAMPLNECPVVGAGRPISPEGKDER